MPVDFDDADISDVVDEVDEQAQQPAADTWNQITEETDVEEQMSEVEARLEVAQYYRLILNETLFDDAPNPAVAERVEEEIRGFVKTRMQALMGVAQPEKAPARIFTDAEVQALRTIAQPDVVGALKALAAKVLKKPTILEAKPLVQEKQRKAPEVPREPLLKKVGQKRRPQQPAPAPTPKARSKPQEKKTRVMVDDAGNEVTQDITPQARPTGPIQPIPTGRSRQAIEAMSAQSAAYQAHIALTALERDLRGK